MQLAPYLNGLCQQYKGKALFTAVYIVEAHAADEWPVGARLSFTKQTRSVQERTDLAKSFCDRFDLDFPMLIDTMTNQFMEAFASWPFRFYVVKGGKVLFKAMPGDGDLAFGFDPATLGAWLAENVA